MLNLFRKKAFGLDICDTSVTACQLKKRGDIIKVVGFGRVELEPGIVEDGRILDKKRLIKAVHELILKTKPERIKTTNLIASIPESRIFAHVFKFPKSLTKEQIKGIISTEAEAVIPLSLDEVYYSWQLVNEQEGKKEVFYVSCPRKIVDDFLDVFKQCKLTPLALDIESASLARVLKKEYNKNEGVLISDIGGRTTILSIFDQAGLRFTENIPIAGNKFTQTLASQLNLNLKEAERKKRKYGFLGKKDGEDIKKILEIVIEEVVLEMQKVINYYQNKSNNKIKKIILCGGSSHLPGIGEYFSRKLNLETEIGKPWFKIEAINGFSYLSLNVLGLALRAFSENSSKDGINLLP